MSEAIILFMLGIPLAIIFVAFQIWASFESTDKHKEARNSLLAGFAIAILIFLVIAYISGWLTKPTQAISTLFSVKIGIVPFLIWTVVLLFLPKFISFVVNKIATLGTKPAETATKKALLKKKTDAKKIKNKFTDRLKTTLDKWHIVSGNPQISSIRGTPQPPSLLLEENPNDRRDTFVLAKNLSFESGKISCEIYLEREAVFNLVFRANSSASEFYMARVDSRNGGSNGFLVARDSRSWTYIKQPNSFVLNDKWHHVELIVDGSKFELAIDNDEPIVVEDTSFLGKGQVGMFNEVKRVFVNKFEVHNFTLETA